MIELLVVIAIIAILAVLLLPALTTAKEKARHAASAIVLASELDFALKLFARAPSLCSVELNQLTDRWFCAGFPFSHSAVEAGWESKLFPCIEVTGVPL